MVLGSFDGTIQVVPLDGGEPHLLFGHEREVKSIKVHPDGDWIASVAEDEPLRLWPMPQGRPVHALPYEELLEKLRSLTNYRVVPDPDTPGGYRVTFDRLPAWGEGVPSW